MRLKRRVVPEKYGGAYLDCEQSLFFLSPSNKNVRDRQMTARATDCSQPRAYLTGKVDLTVLNKVNF